MTIVWMSYAVVITAIVCLAAAAAERLLWIWRAPRRVAWIAALVIAIAAPIVIPVWRGASHSSPVLVPAVATPAAWGPALLTTPHRTSASVVLPAEPADIGGPSALALQHLVADSTLLTIWLGASASLLLFAALTFARLHAQSATWRETTIDGTRVLVSPSCGPAVFGICRQRIVIPRFTLSLDDHSRSLMIRHEREHLHARDSHFILAATLAALLFPWNLALWLLVKRLRLAIELDCDDRVLRGDGDTHAYGSLLLAVSAWRAREMPFAVALAERSSMLERRITAMTAVMPTRRVLVSMPLLVMLTILTVAAARTPSPRRALLRGQASIAPAARTLAEYTPAATHNTATAPGAHDIPPVDAASARHLPRLAASESLPPISATWENASLEDVVAAFAKFSHRRITIAPDVNAVVNATVIDQPWRAALETIMARQGLRVEFRGDSTIYISRQQESAPRRRDINEAAQVSRTVSGTVEDAQTGAPISNAQITLVGGAANASDDGTFQNVPQFYDHGRPAAMSDEAGRFGLRVPSGEVTLQACAAGYEFRRIALGPTDSIAEFHGDRTGQHSQDTVRISRKDIASIEIMKGHTATALYGAAAANGVIELTMKDGTVTHIPVGSDGPTPVLIIDGKVAHDCATERWWIHFRLF